MNFQKAFVLFLMMTMLLPGLATANATIIPAHYRVDIYTSYDADAVVALIKVDDDFINFYNNTVDFISMKYINGTYVKFFMWGNYILIYANLVNYHAEINIFKEYNTYAGKNDTGILTDYGKFQIAVWGFLGKDVAQNIDYSLYRTDDYITIAGLWNELTNKIYISKFSDIHIIFVGYLDYINAYGIRAGFYNNSDLKYIDFLQTYSPSNSYYHYSVDSSNTTNSIFYFRTDVNQTVYTFSYYNYASVNSFTVYNSLTDKYVNRTIDKYYLRSQRIYRLFYTNQSISVNEMKAYSAKSIYSISFVQSEYVLDNQQFVFLMILLLLVVFLSLYTRNIVFDVLLLFLVSVYYFYSFTDENTSIVLYAIAIVLLLYHALNINFRRG